MRRMLLSALAVGLVATTSMASVTPRAGQRPQQLAADSNGFTVTGGAQLFSTVPVTLPTDGIWYGCAASAGTTGPDAQGGWMGVPDQTELWSVTSTQYFVFRITDAWVTGDRFEVYVDGVLQLTTNAVPDGVSPTINPPAVAGPDAFATQGKLWLAFADTRYSHGEIQLAPGTYTINVKDISFPTGFSGAGFGVMADTRRSVPGLPKGDASSVPGENESWGSVKRLFR